MITKIGKSSSLKIITRTFRVPVNVLTRDREVLGAIPISAVTALYGDPLSFFLLAVLFYNVQCLVRGRGRVSGPRALCWTNYSRYVGKPPGVDARRKNRKFIVGIKY